MTQGWKKAVSVMLCAAMILSVSSMMISADDENKPAAENVIEQTQPENENTNETPENNTTEDETPDAENEANKETSEAAKSVIAQLEALPKLDDLTEETDTEALKNQVESAKAAFDALTEEEKASISEELKGNLADLDIFVTNFIVNTPTAIPETESDKIVGDQDGIMTLEEPIALIGDGTEADPYQVDSAEELAEALKKQAQDTVYIQLNEDITTKTTFEITNKTKLMMGSHSIVSTEEKVPALTIKEEVTLENGKISSVTNGVEVANNGNLIVVGTEILATKNHAISMTGGSATINSGSMKGGFSGIALLGGKSLTVEGGNISGAGFGITGNGSYDDTEIVIKGGIITGEGACAIFHPQAGNLTINNGSITGTSGVQYCGAGNLTVTGGTITGTYRYTEKPYKSDKESDGSVDDGAAISIVSRGGGYQSTGDKINVSITGGNLISEHNAAVTAYRFAKIGEKWEINDKTGVDNYLEKLEIGSNAVLKGSKEKGTLEIDEKAKNTVEIQPGAKFEPKTGVNQYLDPAYTLDENGVVVVGQENVVATVDGKGYATVQDAINNADGKTIVLNKDTTETVEVPQGITVTLDLNGKTLKEEKVLNVKGNLTVKDSTAGQPSVDGNYNVSYQSGKIVNIKEDGETQEEKANRVTVCVQSGGTFTLESGTLESKKNYTVEITDNAHAVINGGYQVAQEGGPTVHGSGAVLDVNGGVIEGIDNSAVAGNGTPGLGGTTINITGGTLIGRIQSAGYIANAIYHPQNGVLNITGGTIYAKNGVGILMRNGELNVSGNPSIIATGTASGQVGDKPSDIPGNALVIDYATGYNHDNEITDSRKVSIQGGEFIADKEAISVQTGNGNKEVENFISAGSFSNHIDSKYLDDSLNAELYSPNRNPDAPFSYYPSVEDAKDEAEQFGGTIYDENGDVVATIPAPSKPNPKPEKPSKPSNGGSSDSGSSNSGTTVDKEEEDYNEFWDKVIDRINKADKGDTVTVHAGDYDKMPNKVMKALEKNGVGLIIKYNGGEIEIPAGEAVNKSNKLFWSFKELGNYVFATEDNNEQNNDKQDNEQSNGSENNTQSNTTTEQKPSGTVETKPNPQTGSEDYVGLAAALAVTAGVAAIGLGAKKKK